MIFYKNPNIKDWFQLDLAESGKVRASFGFKPVPIQVEENNNASVAVAWVKVKEGKGLKKSDILGKIEVLT